MSYLISLPGDFFAGVWAALHEHRVWFLLAVSLIGGVVRGYSGFGGAKLFHRSSERMFRLSAYVLIGIAAILSAPLMDKFLK